MYKMNTKIMAALAVFAMVFAGFGMMATAEGNDAAADTDKLTIEVKVAGIVDDKDLVTLIDDADGWAMLYTVIFDDDIEEKITVLTKDYYDAIKDAAKAETGEVSIKGDAVTFVPEILSGKGSVDIGGGDKVAYADILEGLKLFTSLEMSKTGDVVGGVDSTIKYVDDTQVEAKEAVAVALDFVFTDDAEAAIVVAVAAAVAETEAQYADYLSPEEVQAIIDEIKGELYTKEELDAAVNKAVLATKEFYKDYKSPAEVAQAIDMAVEEYKATHPEKDDTFLYVTIVLAAILIALGGFVGYDKVVKPRMAKKVEEQVL